MIPEDFCKARVGFPDKNWVEARYVEIDFKEKMATLSGFGKQSYLPIKPSAEKAAFPLKEIKGIYCDAGEVTISPRGDGANIEFENGNKIVARYVEIDFDIREVSLRGVTDFNVSDKVEEKILEEGRAIAFLPEIEPIKKGDIALPFLPNEEMIEEIRKEEMIQNECKSEILDKV